MAGKRELEAVLTADASSMLRGFKRASSGAANFGKAVAGGAALAGAAVVGAAAATGVALYKIGDDFSKFDQDIAVATGATGKALEDYEQTARNVLASVPDAMETVSGVVGTAATLLQGSQHDLEVVSRHIIDASRLLGEDAAANMESAARAANVFGLSAADTAVFLDDAFRATQKYGIGLTPLTNQLQTFGPLFDNAGFSIGETTKAMGELYAAGVDMSRVGPGLNAFFRKAADSGKDARTEFETVAKSIQGATTDSEALKQATEAFGAEGAQRLASALRSGQVDIDGWSERLEGAQGSIAGTTEATKTMGERFSELKNKAMVAIEPVASALIDRLATGLETVAGYAATVQEAFAEGGLSGVMAMLREKFEEFFPAAKGAQNVFNALTRGVEGAVALIGELVAAFEEGGFSGVLDYLKDWGADAAESLWAWIADVWPKAQAELWKFAGQVGDWLIGTALPAWWAKVQEVAPVLWQWIQDAAPPALRALGNLMDDLWQWFVDEGAPAGLEAIGAMLAALGEWIAGDGKDLWVAQWMNISRATWEWIKDVTPVVLKWLGDMVVKGARYLITTGLPKLVSAFGTFAWAAIEWVDNAIRSIPGKLASLLAVIGNWILFTALPSVARAASSLTGAVLGWIGDAISQAPGKLATLAGTLTGWLYGMPSRISRAASGMWNGIYSAFASMINSVIRAWNNLSFTIPSVSAFGVTVGGQTISTPNISPIGGGSSRTYFRPVSGRNIRLHSGGTFQPNTPNREGLALLRDGERVVDARLPHSEGPQVIEVHIEGSKVLTALVSEQQRRGPLPLKVVAR